MTSRITATTGLDVTGARVVGAASPDLSATRRRVVGAASPDLSVMRRRVVAALIACALFAASLHVTGCTTTTVTEERRCSVIGRIYDECGAVVPGAVVSCGRRRGVSDNTGRFRIESVPYGDYTVTIERSGYETRSVDLSFFSPATFIRVELWSLAGLIDRGIACIEADATDAALKIYRRAASIDSDDRRVKLLRRVMEATR